LFCTANQKNEIYPCSDAQPEKSMCGEKEAWVKEFARKPAAGILERFGFSREQGRRAYLLCSSATVPRACAICSLPHPPTCRGEIRSKCARNNRTGVVPPKDSICPLHSFVRDRRADYLQVCSRTASWKDMTLDVLILEVLEGFGTHCALCYSSFKR
jgi:hypothetical protein